MTENEARKKWCPMEHYRNRANSIYYEGDVVVNCIASDCMMWRWEKADFPHRAEGGYCGLAGKVK